MIADSLTSSEVVCVALCEPGNTYASNAATQFPAGQSPHGCNATDARGTFDMATTTHNGDHCVYSWLFELDQNHQLVRSLTSDTVGLCLDHTKYRYDSNGDGLLDSSDAVWPLCADLPPGFGSAGAPGGADFGCVDTTHAGLPFTLPRAPFELRFAYRQ